MLNRRIRLGAWIAILALAAFQAYAQRYAISPDGMSYLDLSDAVVTGKLGALVNLYWSPLYPFLVGLARLASGGGPQTEVQAMHAVNFVALVGLLAAYDYLLVKVFSMAQARPEVSLRGRWGTACAYGLFATVALTMNPLELTTPDLLSNATILVALGAMLRLRDDTSSRRAAVTLGAALGLGLLAKSFLVPWAIVALACMVIAMYKRGLRELFVAAGVWAVFLLPWTAVLSARAHRVTFGDAGRLTYAWYVNVQDPPSLRVVPVGARTPETEAVLSGTGIVRNAPGTDPMWFDPARWNESVKPHWSFHEQYETAKAMLATLAGSVSVLTYILLLVAIAPSGSRRRAWSDGWIVFVPCLVGIGAYTLVILTARYIMAFILAGLLLSLGTIPVARRVSPTLVLLGLVISIAPLAAGAINTFGFSMCVAVAGAMFVGALTPTRRHVLWMVVVPLTLILTGIIFSPSVPAFTRFAGAAFTLGIWAASRVAISKSRTASFAYGLQMALALSIGLIMVGRLALRVVRDSNAADRAGAVSPEWKIAEDLRSHGIKQGTRIALIGPHAESYWARSARLKIVANVPDPIAPFWWAMPASSRDSLLHIFGEHGAQVAIATRPSPVGPIDSSWTPLRYGGWMRVLPPAGR